MEEKNYEINRDLEDTNNALVTYSDNEVDQLARLMRAEAVGEGDYGMLMVGNVLLNRVISNCGEFKDFLNINTITEAIYQNPGGFSGVNSSLFNTSATDTEKALALRVIQGEAHFPSTNALWFYAPRSGEGCLSSWFGQVNVGKHKNHCFYAPVKGNCTSLY